MKRILTISILLLSPFINAQVGIGTTDPKALFDLTVSDPSAPTPNDGILVPRVSNFPGINPGIDQHGMLVFLTTNVGANTPGFYYWDNNMTSWVPVGVSSGFTVDKIVDADGDSGIELIETATNDSISFKTNNVVVFAIKEGGIHTGFGGDNLFIGKNSGDNADNTGVRDNIGIGRKSLTSLTSGANNTAIGRESLSSVTTGVNNVAIGIGSAKEGITTGNFNTAIGVLALADAGSASNNNTAVGHQTLYNATGNNNTAIGKNAGYNQYFPGSGDANVFVGANAGEENTGNGNVFVGYGAGTTNSSYLTASETLIIDNGYPTPLIYGKFDTKLFQVNGTLNINNAYSLPTTDGILGQVLTTDGSGTVSWSTPTSTGLAETGNDPVPSGVDVQTVVINFTSAFATAPKLQVTVHSASFGEIYVANVKVVNTTQAMIQVYRVDTPAALVGTDVSIDWLATEN